MLVKTDSGGGAAAVKKSTCFSNNFFSLSDAASIVDITIGAPHKWVTLCSARDSQIGSAITRLKQTCVPIIADIVQGKHQPLQ